MSNDLNLPWCSLPYTRDYATVYTTKKEALIATMQAEYAAHIVKCVNEHEGLVAALKVAIECDEAGVTMTYRQMHGARAALAKAQGENQ